MREKIKIVSSPFFFLSLSLFLPLSMNFSLTKCLQLNIRLVCTVSNIDFPAGNNYSRISRRLCQSLQMHFAPYDPEGAFMN